MAYIDSGAYTDVFNLLPGKSAGAKMICGRVTADDADQYDTGLSTVNTVQVTREGSAGTRIYELAAYCFGATTTKGSLRGVVQFMVKGISKATKISQAFAAGANIDLYVLIVGHCI